MLKIGITGGIGSGKTTVCRVFASLGIPVYNADQRAKSIMQSDPDLIKRLKTLFGEDIYDSANNLNRELLAGMVFNDEKKLQSLNAAVHPAIGEDFRKWAEENSEHPYIIKEAALIFESGSYRDLDYTVTVSAPKELRIKRVMKRDGVKRRDVINRMKRQLKEKERLERADFAIRNNDSELVIPQVLDLHRKFMEASLPLR